MAYPAMLNAPNHDRRSLCRKIFATSDYKFTFAQRNALGREADG